MKLISSNVAYNVLIHSNINLDLYLLNLNEYFNLVFGTFNYDFTKKSWCFK